MVLTRRSARIQRWKELRLPPELLQLIIADALGDSIHDALSTPGETAQWDGINVLLRVDKRWRAITSCLLCRLLTSVPHEPEVDRDATQEGNSDQGTRNDLTGEETIDLGNALKRFRSIEVLLTESYFRFGLHPYPDAYQLRRSRYCESMLRAASLPAWELKVSMWDIYYTIWAQKAYLHIVKTGDSELNDGEEEIIQDQAYQETRAALKKLYEDKIPRTWLGLFSATFCQNRLGSLSTMFANSWREIAENDRLIRLASCITWLEIEIDEVLWASLYPGRNVRGNMLELYRHLVGHVDDYLENYENLLHQFGIESQLKEVLFMSVAPPESTLIEDFQLLPGALREIEEQANARGEVEPELPSADDFAALFRIVQETLITTDPLLR